MSQQSSNDGTITFRAFNTKYKMRFAGKLKSLVHFLQILNIIPIFVCKNVFVLYTTFKISVSRHILATLGAGVVFGFSFAYMLLSVAKFGSVQDHYVG